MKVLIKEKLSPHISKTPEGYLVCRDAILGRTGEQDYRKSEIFPDFEGEDCEIKVVRDAKEVFSPEAIASFENKPVTCEHPDVDVTPYNHKDYAVGFVRDVHQGKVDGKDVLLGNLIITDSDIINDIENGIRTDLSCGYTCDISDEKNPRQVNIRGNHVALCEQGRAGNARIVDSAPLVKGLIFKSDMKNVPNLGELAFDEGLYKIGDKIYCLIFHQGTHADRQKVLTEKFNATDFEAFATSLFANHKVDNYDFNALNLYSEMNAPLTKLAMEYFGTNQLNEPVKQKRKVNESVDMIDDDETMRLPKKLKRKISAVLGKMSKFVQDPNYDIVEFIQELEERMRADDESLEFYRDGIKGWFRNSDGMMRKDYFFKVGGYNDTLRISIYADPNTWDTTEVNAYFTDSKESIGDTLYDTYEGHDIDLEDDRYTVNFDGEPQSFGTYDEAMRYIDERMAVTKAMIEDRAIRDQERHTPLFKRELRRALAKEADECEDEEAPDDPLARMKFRQTKNKLLKQLQKYVGSIE